MITEVSKLASQLALPREGHLDVVFHIYSYLKKKHRNVFDPCYPKIDKKAYPTYNWKRFYGDVKEPIPLYAPEPRARK